LGKFYSVVALALAFSFAAHAHEGNVGADLGFKDYVYDRQLTAEEMKTLAPEYRQFVINRAPELLTADENVDILGRLKYQATFANQMLDGIDPWVGTRAPTAAETIASLQSTIDQLKSNSADARAMENADFISSLMADAGVKCFLGRQWDKATGEDRWAHVVKCEVVHADELYADEVLLSVDGETLKPVGVLALLWLEL
jgi:hypothetical protein